MLFINLNGIRSYALTMGILIADYEDAIDLVKRADHPVLGINFDTLLLQQVA